MRVEQRRIPGDDAAPVVPYQEELVFAESVRETYNIRGQIENVVVLDTFRATAGAVPSLIRYGYAKPRCFQRIDLVTPQVPASWKSMQQDDERPVTFHNRPQCDAIGGQIPFVPPNAIQYVLAPRFFSVLL